jgi:hypothetical protein
MRTTVEFKGIPELILEKAVKIGLARSKTDALRMGVFALNNEYRLLKNIELELVEKRINEEQQEMKKKGLKYLSEEEALAKYK